MERKTIGSFISAMRRASGMIQQELADRLNVSPKAVSRWERDESAPDITLIPAIAEIFGITCDELLKGERIFDLQDKGNGNGASTSERREPRVERMQKALIRRTITSYKTLVWVSIALSALGLVCMFGISRGFYLPVVGFALMLLMTIPAIIITAIAVGRMRDARLDNELFDTSPAPLLEEYDRALGTYSYCAYAAAITAIVLSLPPIFFLSGYTHSVLSFNSYLRFFTVLAPTLALLFGLLKNSYCARVTGRPAPQRRPNRRAVIMNVIQLTALAFAAAVYFSFPPSAAYKAGMIGDAIYLLALGMLLADILAFVVFLAKYKSDRRALILPGARNMLLIFPVVLIGSIPATPANTAIIIGLAAAIFAIFMLLSATTQKSR